MFAETPDIRVIFMVAETKLTKYFLILKNDYLLQHQLYSLDNFFTI